MLIGSFFEVSCFKGYYAAVYRPCIVFYGRDAYNDSKRNTERKRIAV